MFRPLTIDYEGALPGERSRRQKRDYQACGCPRGRACSCDANPEKMQHSLAYCGKCDNCLRNQHSLQRTGRMGKRRCRDPPFNENAIIRVRVGRAIVKLRREQLDFFQKQSPTLVRQSSKSSTYKLCKTSDSHGDNVDSNKTTVLVQDENPRSTESENRKGGDLDVSTAQKQHSSNAFASAVLAHIFLLRAGHKKRGRELRATIAACEHEAEELRASLEQLRERAVCVGPDEKLHVDTMVKHATWQRVSLDVAVATHTDQIAAADAKAAAARDEIAEIDQELTTHAANVIQSCLRGVLKRTEPERTECAKVEQNNTGSAVTIQRVFRGVLGRRYVALVRHRRREAAAIFVQRVWRGYKGRIRALNIESIRAEQARLEAAIMIQRFWSDSKQASIVRAQKQAVLAAKEAELQHQQAITIQRIVRGYLAREQKRCRRVELKLGPRVRELANRYIARGDLYSFLQAVNRDYELHMAQQAELRKMELENAATFIEEVLAHRDQEVQARWREWERQKLALRNTDEAIQIYGPGGSQRRPNPSNSLPRTRPRRQGKPRAPQPLKSISRASKPMGFKVGGTSTHRRKRPPYMPTPMQARQEKRYQEAMQSKFNSRGSRERTRSHLGKCRAAINARTGEDPRYQGKLRDAEAAAYAVPEVPQMVSIPSRKAVVKDPISRTSAKGPSALDVVAPSQLNNQLTAQDFAFAPYATQLRATEVPHMDVPLDNLVFQAALREYIGQIRFGEPGRSRDAIMEHFILSAPATLRIAAEEEALQVSTPIISALRSRDVLTCRELLQVAERLETDYMVPPALASTIRSLLGAAVRNISNTRPASVQEKWREVLEETKPNQHLVLSSDPNCRASTAISHRAPGTAPVASGPHCANSSRAKSQAHKTESGGLPPRGPERTAARSKTAGSLYRQGKHQAQPTHQQHLKMEMDMKDDTSAQILEIDQDDLNLRLMGHFGVSDTSRPVSSAETICYEESSSPMLSDRNTFDQTSDTRQPTAQGGNGEIACQARPKTSGGLFESSLRPGTSALREWDWRAPMGLPIEFVEVRPFTAGPIADGISTANLERRPSTQSSSATGSSAGTRVTFAPNVTDRPSTQASAFSSLSDVSRPPSRASYASTVGTVDWNHASEDKATALEGSDIQIWTADIGRSNDDNDDDDDNRESAVEKEAKKDDSRNGNCATNDNGLSQKQSRQFAQQAQLLAVSTPQLDSSIHDLLIHILLTGPPEGFEAYGLEDLARELAKLPPEAEAARREMARAHYRAVRSEASTLAKPLSRAGFEEVHALAACPLSSFAIPREIVAVLQSRFQEISSAGDDSSRPFDARLCRSGVGTLGHARHRKEGLSPVRMDRARHYADGTMDFPISAKSGPRREQLVERILHRAEDLARATAVPVAKASAEDAMERNYHEWKRGPKVGLNAIVTTHEEAASLVGWHPFPQG